MAVQTTSGLTQEMATYYEKVFLARAKHIIVHDQGAQKRTLPNNVGKTVVFTRKTPFTTVTGSLTEGSNPSEVALTSTNVSATVAEYGNVVNYSRLLSLTSIDVNMKELADTMGQNMGETVDQLTRDELYTGATVQLAGGKSALSDLAASDVLNYKELRLAVRTLKGNKATRYPDGFFLGKIGYHSSFDLQGDTNWVNAHTYKDGDNLYRGEIGKLAGVRVIETTLEKSESSTVTVYSNFVHGQDAFGCFDLEGDMPKLYILTPSQIDSNNPTGRNGKIGWAGSYVTKTLNANWLINIKVGATA